MNQRELVVRDIEKHNLLQIAEPFINSKDRVKCFDKWKQRGFPFSIHNFYNNPFHQKKNVKLHKNK